MLAWFRNARTFIIVTALLAAVYLLPPDTSLAQVRQAGVLRACVPTSYPPLVTGDANEPGIDIELLQGIATDIGVRLQLVTNSNIGRDFNPRNWRVTRAQCHVIAGGVVVSNLTRSFLETTPPHLETGWALVLPGPLEALKDRTIGFFAGATGLDRIALSRFLRGQQAQVDIVSSADDFVEGLTDGTFDSGVSEALRARSLAGENNWQAQWLPPPLERRAIAFGLWKGDLTLKRKIVSALRRLERSGETARLIEKYEIAPIAEECEPCGAVVDR